MSKKLRLGRWGWENVFFYIALHQLSAMDNNDYIPVLLCGISCNYDALSCVRWSSLSGLTLWRLRGSRSSLLMTLTGTTPGLVRNLVLLQYHVWTKISRFCASIWFLILSLQPQLQGRSTSGKALGWVDSRRSMVAARGMAPAHHTSARAVVPFHVTSCSSCRRWASLMLTPRGNPTVKCLCLAC